MNIKKEGDSKRVCPIPRGATVHVQVETTRNRWDAE